MKVKVILEWDGIQGFGLALEMLVNMFGNLSLSYLYIIQEIDPFDAKPFLTSWIVQHERGNMLEKVAADKKSNTNKIYAAIGFQADTE
jgi:hypothetical protein